MKKQLRKIFTLVISLIFILNMIYVPSSYASDSDIKSDGAQAYNFLKSVGVLKDDEEAYADDKVITRAHFLKLILNAQNIFCENKGEAKNIFSDVNSGSEYASYIKTAYELGYINGDGSGCFNPELPITFPAAIKIISSVLGYSYLAEANGGYPVGYYKYANEYEITDNVNEDDFSSLNMACVMIMLKNAVNAEILEISGMKNGNLTVSNNKNTVLSKYYDIFNIEEIINGNEYTKLYSQDSDIPSGCVEAGGMTLDAGDTNAADYVGCKAEIYYKYSFDMSKPVIVYIDYSDDVKISTYAFDELTFDSDRVSYTENNKDKNINIDKLAVYLLNGKMASVDMNGFSDDDKGFVTFIANSGGSVDVVSVIRYETYIVNGVSRGDITEISYDGGKLSFDETSDDIGISVFKSGKAAELSDIEPDNVILVAKSIGKGKTKVKIDISDNTAEAIVKEVGSDELKTEGGVYKCSEDILKTVTAGKNYKLYIDSLGNVCKAEQINTYVYGYLYGVRRDGLDGVECRIYSENGNWVDIPLADKVKMSYNKKIGKDDVLTLFSGDPDSYRQLIRYSVTAERKINALETAKSIDVGSDEEFTASDENVFRLMFDGGSYWRNGPKMFDGKFSVNGSTKIFCIPDDKSDTDKYYIKRVDIFEPDEKYNIKVYDTDPCLNVGALVVNDYKESFNYTNNFIVVRDIVTKLNHDDEDVPAISGWWNGYELSFSVRTGESISQSDIDKLKRGDVIQFIMNDDDEIISFILCSGDSDGYFLYNNFYNRFSLIGARVMSCDYKKGLIRAEYQPFTVGVIKTNSQTKVYIYDTNSQTCYEGSANDILESDRITAKLNYLTANEIVITR